MQNILFHSLSGLKASERRREPISVEVTQSELTKAAKIMLRLKKRRYSTRKTLRHFNRSKKPQCTGIGRRAKKDEV